MLVLSCCIFQSSMTMVLGLDCCLAVCVYICVCVYVSMRACLPDPSPHDLLLNEPLFLYNMNVEFQSVNSDSCSVNVLLL